MEQHAKESLPYSSCQLVVVELCSHSFVVTQPLLPQLRVQLSDQRQPDPFPVFLGLCCAFA